MKEDCRNGAPQISFVKTKSGSIELDSPSAYVSISDHHFHTRPKVLEFLQGDNDVVDRNDTYEGYSTVGMKLNDESQANFSKKQQVVDILEREDNGYQPNHELPQMPSTLEAKTLSEHESTTSHNDASLINGLTPQKSNTESPHLEEKMEGSMPTEKWFQEIDDFLAKIGHNNGKSNDKKIAQRASTYSQATRPKLLVPSQAPMMRSVSLSESNRREGGEEDEVDAAGVRKGLNEMWRRGSTRVRQRYRKFSEYIVVTSEDAKNEIHIRSEMEKVSRSKIHILHELMKLPSTTPELLNSVKVHHRHMMEKLEKKLQETQRKSMVRYYFQHPYSRLLISITVLFLNLVLFADDPISNSFMKASFVGLGQVIGLVGVRWTTPHPWYAVIARILCILMGLGGGLMLGILLHKFVLNKWLRLKMFQDQIGSWLVKIISVVLALFGFSMAYNFFLLLIMEDPGQLLIDDIIPITNEDFYKVAATCTFSGDFFTAILVIDSMLQDRALYPGWAPSLRRLIQKRPRVRIYAFWIITVASFTFVIFQITIQPFTHIVGGNIFDWNYWMSQRKTTTKGQRIMLASIIWSMDIIIVMQDWEYPHFTPNFHIKLPGLNSSSFLFHWKVPKLVTKIPLFTEDGVLHISISGKWFNYGVLVFIMCLDTNMFKNQFLYDPANYGQYMGPIRNGDESMRDVIWAIRDKYSLNNGSTGYWNYDFRSQYLIKDLPYLQGVDKWINTNLSLTENDDQLSARYTTSPHTLLYICGLTPPFIMLLSLIVTFKILSSTFTQEEIKMGNVKRKLREEQSFPNIAQALAQAINGMNSGLSLGIKQESDGGEGGGVKRSIYTPREGSLYEECIPNYSETLYKDKATDNVFNVSQKKKKNSSSNIDWPLEVELHKVAADSIDSEVYQLPRGGRVPGNDYGRDSVDMTHGANATKISIGEDDKVLRADNHLMTKPLDKSSLEKRGNNPLGTCDILPANIAKSNLCSSDGIKGTRSKNRRVSFEESISHKRIESRNQHNIRRYASNNERDWADCRSPHKLETIDDNPCEGNQKISWAEYRASHKLESIDHHPGDIIQKTIRKDKAADINKNDNENDEVFTNNLQSVNIKKTGGILVNRAQPNKNNTYPRSHQNNRLKKRSLAEEAFIDYSRINQECDDSTRLSQLDSPDRNEFTHNTDTTYSPLENRKKRTRKIAVSQNNFEFYKNDAKNSTADVNLSEIINVQSTVNTINNDHQNKLNQNSSNYHFMSKPKKAKAVGSHDPPFREDQVVCTMESNSKPTDKQVVKSSHVKATPPTKHFYSDGYTNYGLEIEAEGKDSQNMLQTRKRTALPHRQYEQLAMNGIDNTSFTIDL